jgi:uncharacterized protein YkwD
VLVILAISDLASAQGIDADVDGSGVADAVDVQLVINGALGVPGDVATDVNGDASTDAIDVQMVINAVLGIEDGGDEVEPNEEELATHDLVNAERTGEGLANLVMRNDLVAVARAHSQDMIDRDFIDHDNPDGDDPFERMTAAGITYSSAGENIAVNNFPNPIETAVDGWMNSSGHRANILRDAFTHTGHGVVESPDGRWYFTQVFIGVSKDGQSKAALLFLSD